MSTEDKLDSEPTTDPSDAPGADSELLAEGMQLAASDALETSEDDDDGASKRSSVGIERWVQLGFMVAAILLVWLYDHIISGIWYVFADPNESIVTAGAVVAGLITAIILYKTAPVYSLVHGVTDELSKVSWPTRKETSSSTVTVIVTSIVAGLVLFLFDSVWAAVTDLVYKV